MALSESKAAEFLEFQRNTDTVLNFCYLAIKLPSFKSADEELPELEPRVSHSFVLKIFSRKKLLNLKSTSGEIFLFQNLVVCLKYHNYTSFAVLKLYL